ncbi:MAG: hypothetical protein JKY22_02905, partial [Flavobacteriaceae bacterium]|nr:hypothetical protein [Flavobacteriaceae bacterium]
MFPFPYKWLMGTGVYFYVKNQFESEGNRSYLKKEWWLFAPAILYGLLRTYWFAIAVSENSFRITGVVINSGFFRIHEIFYLVFGIVLGIASLQFIKKNMGNYLIQGKQLKVLKWLQLFTWVFLIKTCVDLTIYIIDLSIHGGQESFLLYYPILLLNSAFIYWIGYIGFTKPTIFFSKFKLRSKQQLSEKDIRLQHQLKYFMEESEVFTNP